MFNYILLQSSNTSQIINLVFIIGIFVVFYIFIILPQQRKQKKQKQFQENLKKGDEVVTIGGIYGKILSLDGDTISLEIDKGVKIKLEKSAISLEQTVAIKKN